MSHLVEIEAKSFKTISGEDFNSEDLLYIDKLYEALEEMKGNFLNKIDPLTKQKREAKERNYSSHLCGLVGAKLRENIPHSNPLDLNCESEDSKTFYIKAFEGLHGKEKEPDLYIHKGENPVEGIQELICEVKRLSMLTPENLMGDLNKLISYSSLEIWEGHGFKIAVFIVNNGNKKQLKNKIDGFMHNNYPIENLLTEGVTNMTLSEFVTTYQKHLKNILCFCHS